MYAASPPCVHHVHTQKWLPVDRAGVAVVIFVFIAVSLLWNSWPSTSATPTNIVELTSIDRGGFPIMAQQSRWCLDWGKTIVRSMKCGAPPPRTQKWYLESHHIKDVDGRCLDAAGAHVHVWDCGSAGDKLDRHQNWTYDLITRQLKHSGGDGLTCLEDSFGEDQRLVMMPCNSWNLFQKWLIALPSVPPVTSFPASPTERSDAASLSDDMASNASVQPTLVPAESSTTPNGTSSKLAPSTSVQRTLEPSTTSTTSSNSSSSSFGSSTGRSSTGSTTLGARLLPSTSSSGPHNRISSSSSHQGQPLLPLPHRPTPPNTQNASHSLWTPFGALSPGEALAAVQAAAASGKVANTTLDPGSLEGRLVAMGDSSPSMAGTVAAPLAPLGSAAPPPASSSGLRAGPSTTWGVHTVPPVLRGGSNYTSTTTTRFVALGGNRFVLHKGISNVSTDSGDKEKPDNAKSKTVIRAFCIFYVPMVLGGFLFCVIPRFFVHTKLMDYCECKQIDFGNAQFSHSTPPREEK